MADRFALDPAAFQAFRDSLGRDGGEAFRTILRLFVSDAPKQIMALRKGVEENDLAMLQRAAHTLRSNNNTLGALELAGLCRELETSCRQGDRSKWVEQMGAIETLFLQVLQAVQAELDRSLPGGDA